MDDQAWYRVLADGILVLHTALVGFVVLALPITLIGGFLKWQWVRNPWFRGVHLLLIGIVVAQSWLGLVCPLTQWENQLRQAAGQAGYEHGFIAHWFGQILFWNAPSWVFITAYSVFGLLVLLSFWWVPVRWRKHNH